MASVPQPHGGALNNGGTPGHKGGTGRPRDEFKRWMREMASGEDVERGLEAILKDSTTPLFLGALKHVTEHGYGKPEREKVESQQVDTRRLIAVVHQAVTEICSPVVSDRIRARVEQLLTEPELHLAS